MRRDRESFNSPANPKNSQQKLEGNQIISPYDVIRMKNCKLFKFRRDETYPSIRPPVSQCDPEETAAFLAASMEANGLGSFDPRFVRQSPIGVSSMSSDRKMGRSNERGIEIVNPCRTRRVQEPLYKPGAGRDSHMVLDWSKITPCDLMRLQNCKAFDFQKCERYPSIRPPASLCNAEWTAQWLASAVENYGCPRLFDMEIDDILDIWKRSPGKESLGFYGVGSGIATPEAIEYNQLVSKCLEKVSGRKRAEHKEDVMNPLAKSEAKPVTKTPGILLLNRSKLESKITKMPTVRKKLHPSTALNWIHCPGQAPRSALETENPVGKTKQREQQFCDCQLDAPENKCTDYEWMKYKEVAVSFQKELQQLATEFENEPKNYDDLYAQLVSCFDKDAAQDPIAASYYKCCKRFSKSGGAQGAGKGGKGGGKYGDGGGDGDGRRTGDGDEAGDGNEAGDGDVEGAEHGELGETKGVAFEGIQGEGEGGASAYGLGDGGQAAALGEKDKAAAGAGIGIGGTGSGDGKTKTKKPGDVKTDKADKAGGKDSKKTAAKSAKDLGKRPAADAKYPKDQAGQQPGAVKMFEFPNTLESVTEGETNSTEQKWISDLQNGSDDEIADSSRSSFWKRPSQEELGRKGKGKGGKGGKRKGSKAIGRGRGRKSGKESHSTDSTQARTKDCPCEICELLTRRKRDPPDPPFILEMLKEQKHRQTIEYRQRLCHQAYLLRRCPEYPAPAHRCEPIQCNEPSSFSLHPKIAEYFDRLTALNDLQKLLCSKRDKVDRQLLQLVQNLKDRLCWRLNQLL